MPLDYTHSVCRTKLGLYHTCITWYLAFFPAVFLLRWFLWLSFQMKVENKCNIMVGTLVTGSVLTYRNRIMDPVSENNICPVPSWIEFQYLACIDVVIVITITNKWRLPSLLVLNCSLIAFIRFSHFTFLPILLGVTLVSIYCFNTVSGCHDFSSWDMIAIVN